MRERCSARTFPELRLIAVLCITRHAVLTVVDTIFLIVPLRIPDLPMTTVRAPGAYVHAGETSSDMRYSSLFYLGGE